MIASLRGTLLEKTEEGAVVEAGGVGYALALSASVRDSLPSAGAPVFFHVTESVAMYGGGVSLYGFPSLAEKRVFQTLKDHVPGTGAKKALEFLDKASKSLPEFRQALVDKDAKRLVALFGFTPKTAEKLVAGLRNKLDAFPAFPIDPRGSGGGTAFFDEAVQGLVALGYREAEAREAARACRESLGGDVSSSALIQAALRILSGR